MNAVSGSGSHRHIFVIRYYHRASASSVAEQALARLMVVRMEMPTMMMLMMLMGDRAEADFAAKKKNPGSQLNTKYTYYIGSCVLRMCFRN